MTDLKIEDRIKQWYDLPHGTVAVDDYNTLLWDAEKELRRLRGLDEALHENCTLAEGHPTLKLLDEARAEIGRLKNPVCSHATGPYGQLGVAQQLLWDIWEERLDMTHDVGCPEDDTCECEVVQRLNEAMEGFKDGNQ